MSAVATPVLDARAAADFYAGLTALQSAFVPELPPASSGQATALLQIVARFSAIVTQRLNQAPDLDKLAFLDMLGISLIPAQPARAPLVFQPLPLTVDGHIPAGTRAGASAPGVSSPTVFSTETDIAMTTAQLTQVVSLWPDQDGYIDHSTDLAGKRPFTLFRSPTPIEHVLYLSQQTVLAFKGQSTVEIRFALTINGSAAVTIRWEFWDGATWRSFRDFDETDPAASQDGTAGLTRSGIVRLQADCGDSAATSVGNITNSWIRGRLTVPLPPNSSRIFAVANQVSLRTTIDRSLTHGPGGTDCKGVAQIDAAYAGSTTLDLTKIFYPLGKAPGPDAVFYFVCQEVFSKPGAQVTLCIDRATTPEQEGDAAGAQYAPVAAQAAADLVQAAKAAAVAAVNDAKGVVDLFAGQVDVTAANTAISSLTTAALSLSALSDIAALNTLLGNVLTPLQALFSTASAINTGNWLSAMEFQLFYQHLQPGRRHLPGRAKFHRRAGADHRGGGCGGRRRGTSAAVSTAAGVGVLQRHGLGHPSRTGQRQRHQPDGQRRNHLQGAARHQRVHDQWRPGARHARALGQRQLQRPAAGHLDRSEYR